MFYYGNRNIQNKCILLCPLLKNIEFWFNKGHRGTFILDIEVGLFNWSVSSYIFTKNISTFSTVNPNEKIKTSGEKLGGGGRTFCLLHNVASSFAFWPHPFFVSTLNEIFPTFSSKWFSLFFCDTKNVLLPQQ